MRTELRAGLSEAHTLLRAFLAHSWSRRRGPTREPPEPRSASTDGPRSPCEGRGLRHAGSAKPTGRAQRRPKGAGPAQGRRQCTSGLPACLLRRAPGTAGCQMAGRVVGTRSTTGHPWLRKGSHRCWGGTWPGQGRTPAQVPQDQPPPRSTLFFQASPPFSFSHCREPPGTFQDPSHTRGLAWVSAKAGFCYRQDLIRSTSGWSQTWMGPLSLGPVTPAGTGEAGSPRAEGQSWPQDPQGAAPSRDREKPKGPHGRNARAASTASRRPLIIQLLTL